MQQLTYKDLEDRQVSEVFDVPKGMHGVSFNVSDGKGDVLLSIDGKEIHLSIQGARNLAMALRQSANRQEVQLLGRTRKRRKK
jgi:hypothetical protein